MTGSWQLRVGGLAITRGAVGAALVLVAPLVSDRCGPPYRRPVLWATRLLAARHLVEASALAAARPPGLRRGIALVDAAHGTSMVLLAVRSRGLRAVAIAAAAEAFALAVTTYPSSSPRTWSSR